MTQLLQKRDATEATAQLYDRHHRRIRGYCLGQLHDSEEANDAVQSTFLYAFSSLQRGIEPREELPWLFTIAHNVCRTRRRSLRRRSRLEADVDLDTVCDTIGRDDPSRDDLDTLGRSLAALPDNQRRALLLREWQGLSYAEVATRMGLTESAVEAVLFRARRNLAQKLRVTERVASVGTLLAGGLRRLGSLAWFGKTAAATVAVGLAAGTAVRPFVLPPHRVRPPQVPSARTERPASTHTLHSFARVQAAPHTRHAGRTRPTPSMSPRPSEAGRLYVAAPRAAEPTPTPAAPDGAVAAAPQSESNAALPERPTDGTANAPRASAPPAPVASTAAVAALAPPTTTDLTSVLPPPVQTVTQALPLPGRAASDPPVPVPVPVDVSTVTTPSAPLPDTPGLPSVPPPAPPQLPDVSTTLSTPPSPAIPPAPLPDDPPQGTPLPTP